MFILTCYDVFILTTDKCEIALDSFVIDEQNYSNCTHKVYEVDSIPSHVEPLKYKYIDGEFIEYTPEEEVEPEPEIPELTLEEKTLSNTEQIIEDNITLMMAQADSFEQQSAIQADQFTIMDAIADLYEQIALLQQGGE